MFFTPRSVYQVPNGRCVEGSCQVVVVVVVAVVVVVVVVVIVVGHGDAGTKVESSSSLVLLLQMFAQKGSGTEPLRYAKCDRAEPHRATNYTLTYRETALWPSCAYEKSRP